MSHLFRSVLATGAVLSVSGGLLTALKWHATFGEMWHVLNPMSVLLMVALMLGEVHRIHLASELDLFEYGYQSARSRGARHKGAETRGDYVGRAERRAERLAERRARK